MKGNEIEELEVSFILDSATFIKATVSSNPSSRTGHVAPFVGFQRGSTTPPSVKRE
ncbi:MAG: hypothetical protein HOO93_13390 [Methyloglobulus sp.]|nr:hypothetical protein [Methyloglobulus sp.]